MIMSYTQNNPRIKTQLMLLHVNVTELLRLLQTQRSSYRLHRTKIKPPRPPLQTMTRLCSAMEKLYDWMKKPWTSSGSTRLRGIASRILAAPRMFSHRQGSSLLYNKRSTPFSVPSHVMVPPHLHRNQHGRLSCSAAGSSWDVSPQGCDTPESRTELPVELCNGDRQEGDMGGGRCVLGTLPCDTRGGRQDERTEGTITLLRERRCGSAW